MGVVIRKSWRVDLATLPWLDASVMEMVGKEVREVIVRRTLAGKDQDGAAFEPYSEGYAQRKTDSLGTTRVDLAASGEMLDNLGIVDVTDRKVVLGWRR
jgi:hypothetical protein